VNRMFCLLAGLAVLTTPVLAQDPVERGVRIGITYSPGVLPGLLVLSGPRSLVLDSARAILARDLDYSDEFEMITLPTGDSLSIGIGREATSEVVAPSSLNEAFINYPLFAALGADFAINVHEDVDQTVVATLLDVRGARIQRQIRLTQTNPTDHDFRLEIHSAADEFVRAVVGTPGVASTRILFINRGRIYRTDSDGADTYAISPSDVEAMSPAWTPDGREAAYMEFPGTLYRHDVRTGTRRVIVPTQEHQNFTPEYSPDGRSIAFSRATSDGTHVYTYNLVDDCCLQRLTVGRLYDNLSPTFSPDGRRIAFVSTRSGIAQIYVMGADGTGQELFAPFDYGVTGSSNAPEWSPDGAYVAFHREIDRSPQIFVMETATRTVRQLTNLNRNSDPSWAPDSRHLAFVSERTGSRQVWIIDIRTGKVRQLTRLGEARLPSWSPRIIEQVPNN